MEDRILLFQERVKNLHCADMGVHLMTTELSSFFKNV